MNNLDLLKEVEKTLLDFKAVLEKENDTPATSEKLFKIQPKVWETINDKEGIPLGCVGEGVRVVYGNPTDVHGSSIIDTVIVGHVDDLNRDGVKLELIPLPHGLGVYECLGLFGHRHLLSRIRYDDKSGIENQLGKGSYGHFKSLASLAEIKATQLRSVGAIKEALFN